MQTSNNRTLGEPTKMPGLRALCSCIPLTWFLPPSQSCMLASFAAVLAAHVETDPRPSWQFDLEQEVSKLGTTRQASAGLSTTWVRQSWRAKHGLGFRVLRDKD